MVKLIMFLIILMTLSLSIGCANPKVSLESTHSERRSTWEWQTSTPENQAMDVVKLSQIMDYIDEENLDMHSLIVVRNGYIVLEEYWGRYKPYTVHDTYSVTKSFTSALIGIAMREGYIESLEQKVLDFFPDMTLENPDSRKGNITLKHILTMSAGLEWDEEKTFLGNPIFKMTTADDPVQYVLDLQVVSRPGTKWNYNSGISHLLSAIITEITPYDTLGFAQEFLFGPLGIYEGSWQRYRNGTYIGGYGLELLPRDMAKLGLLYLQNGNWNGEQVVPADYIAESVKTH